MFNPVTNASAESFQKLFDFAFKEQSIYHSRRSSPSDDHTDHEPLRLGNDFTVPRTHTALNRGFYGSCHDTYQFAAMASPPGRTLADQASSREDAATSWNTP